MAAAVIESAVLAKAMRFAASIVASAQTIPILANVRLDASGDTLEVTTSDMDTEFRQVLPLTEPADGRLLTTVSAARLKDMAGAAAPGSQMQLSLDGLRLTVKAGRSRWILPALEADKFPPMPVDDLCEPVTFDNAQVLDTTIGRVAWYASTEVSQPHLTGISLQAKDGKLRIAAAEKAGVVMVALDQAVPADVPGVIMPAKYARTLASLCAAHDGPAAIAWDTRKIRATVGDAVLTGKLIEATFPDYDRVVPKPCVPVIIEPETARAAIRRVQLVQATRTSGIKLERATGQVVFSATASESGDAREEVPADCEEGPYTGFNAAILSNMIEAIGGDSIEIHQEMPGAPVMFRRVVDDGSLGIVMPYRV